MANDSFPGTLMAKPFLKWAGGKWQLITEIESALPKNIHKKKELTYIEPFIGSGAISANKSVKRWLKPNILDKTN